ncbi:MAG: ATP-binding protein [Planctomycetota bacterium]
MILAIASGKGGTGKTTIATNLAVALASEGETVTYADCDVEAPNGHIFMKPNIRETVRVAMRAPVIDAEKCTHCGECEKICQFNAIVSIKDKILFFRELCHGCGGCALVCPTGAITETPRDMGVVEVGDARGIGFIHGKLNVGEAVSPRVIAEIKRRLDPGRLTILDSPPGTACPAIEAMKETNHVLLVAEPTPFGLNDLEIAYEVVQVLDIPCSLAINQSNIGDGRVKEFAQSNGIPVILEISHDRRIAECYSRGDLVVEALPEYKDVFLATFDRIAGAEPCQKKLS